VECHNSSGAKHRSCSDTKLNPGSLLKNLAYNPLDPAPTTGSFRDHFAKPFTGARERRTQTQSCSESVYLRRRFRNGIARGESMMFIAGTSNRPRAGFQVESQDCSAVNGYAGSQWQFGNPCRRCNRDNCLRRPAHLKLAFRVRKGKTDNTPEDRTFAVRCREDRG
jgi:hypothetical protein